ncbi:MAG: FHA domain-containing serine/threonine-protein kinase [Pirellulaceae bacterium]
MPFLVIVGGPDRGRNFEITEGQTLVIGRSQTSDTQINDPRVSRVHCRVVIDGGTVTLLDNDSAGGTFCGGTQISRQELKTGDTFAVGDTTIRYQLDSDVPDEQATVAPVAQADAVPQKTPQLMDMVGQTLAHYRLDKIIAKGNTGMIFKAQDLENDRVAAVKVLTPDPNHSDEQRDRFVRAMKTMLPIKHDHLITLYHAGKTGPFCWAAMQYVDGESLTELISRMGIEGMLDWRETWRIGVQIGRALDAAYEQKIIHRNVTPTNILRRTSDRACLLGDLMLAKALDGTFSQQITQPGQLVGEVPYMAPERTRDSDPVDTRSDIYGLGATLYALMAGRPPFDSSSLPELVRMVREDDPTPPKQYQLSINDKFQDAVARMLAKSPDDRYQTPTELLQDLERIGRFNNLEADWTGWSG